MNANERREEKWNQFICVFLRSSAVPNFFLGALGVLGVCLSFFEPAPACRKPFAIRKDCHKPVPSLVDNFNRPTGFATRRRGDI